MHWQPTLESERVHLRPLRAEDWPELMNAAADPLIWHLHPEPTRYRPEVFAKFFADAMASAGAFAVVDPQTQAVIGSSRFTGHRVPERSIEIGYTFLTRAYWGGDCNRAMKTLMLDYAFQWVDRVCFLVGQSNLRSRRAMEKIGGTLWSGLGAPPINDPLSQNVLYVIEREAWPALRTRV